jgi:hypothetical protein
MDATAFALCRDQKLPIKVFSIVKPGALMRVIWVRTKARWSTFKRKRHYSSDTVSEDSECIHRGIPSEQQNKKQHVQLTLKRTPRRWRSRWKPEGRSGQSPYRPRPYGHPGPRDGRLLRFADGADPGGQRDLIDARTIGVQPWERRWLAIEKPSATPTWA